MTNRFRSMMQAVATAAAVVLLAGCEAVVQENSRRSRTAGTADSAAAQRPGLGTGWGEERKSATSATSFRRSSSAPIATSRIYYNDEAGTDALLARSGGRKDKTTSLMMATGGP